MSSPEQGPQVEEHESTAGMSAQETEAHKTPEVQSFWELRIGPTTVSAREKPTAACASLGCTRTKSFMAERDALYSTLHRIPERGRPTGGVCFLVQSHITHISFPSSARNEPWLKRC